MDSPPLVSILIPCFNAERYVGAAIDSALAQDHPRVEVVVVDDGSTDGSLDVIRRYADRPSFRFESGPNRGGNAARNRLLQLAQGEFVQYLDADDLLDPKKVSTCLAAMGEDIDMVFCDFIVSSSGQCREVRFEAMGDDVVEYFVRQSVQTSIPLHRAAALRQVGGFDETLQCCQEYELHLRLARRVWRKVVHLPEPLCTVVKVSGSVSSNESRVFSQMARILAGLFDELESQGRLTPGRREALAKQLHFCCRHLARHGLDDQALAAHELAGRIAPGSRAEVRWPMRVLAKLLGPVRAERLRQRVRSR